MPVTVVVRPPRSDADGRAAETLSLTFDGERVVIGRGPGSDVRLPDPSVSVRHATIRASGADYAIVDEGSTNGTWVGGVRLAPQAPRLVKTGDLVRVGRVWIELEIGQRPATPDLGLATRDLALALVRQAMDAAGDDTVTKLRVAEGPDFGALLRLLDEGRTYVVGRGESCDLPLADADASREHAAVTRRGGHVLLRDLGSRNGVFLGDQRLAPDRDVVWRATVMARIGRTVVALEEPVNVALAALEAAGDEALRAEDAPPPPVEEAATGEGAPGRPEGAAPAPGASSEVPDEAPGSRMPPSSAAGAAPIAEIVPGTTVTTPLRRRRGWTVTDVLVVTLALAVIGASVAGLAWVLR